MTDLSYFQEPVEVLVTEEVGHMDEATQEWVVDSPAIYETQQQIRRRCQSVSHGDLLRIIGKQLNGIRLDAKILLEQETVQWEWFDRYHAYQYEVMQVNEWNAVNAGTFQDDMGAAFTVDPRELPVAPIRPPTISPTQWRLNNYVILRQAAYGSWESQMELLYDDQKNGTTKFRDAIDSVKTTYGKPPPP